MRLTISKALKGGGILQSKAMKTTKKAWTGKRDDVVFYAVMAALPLLQFFLMYICVNFNSFLLAFKNVDPLQKGAAFTFDNITAAFTTLTSAEFLRFEMNSVLMMVLISGIGVCLGLLFSFYIYKQYFFSNAFKVILYAPSIISAVVMAIIFSNFVEIAIPAYVEKWMNEPIKGLIDNGDTVFATVIFYNVWISFGTSVLLYSNNMSAISSEIVEAAHIDGATGLQEFWYIILPHVYPVMTTFIITSVAGIFTNQFQVYTLIPSNVDDSVKSLGYYFFRESAAVASSPSDIVYAKLSAMGILLTCICIPLTFGVRWVMEKFGPSEE